ncbi:MAG: diacylglycerol kinase family lipid kinase [Burkholderiales bacterium]|nr:diacylglycerol kinase family lipid kinase [Bacteroidia bacterium]
MTQKIAFVINPNAGVKKKIDIIEFIKTKFSKHIQYDLIVWKNKDDFESVKQDILSGNYSIVVACGGDGTVNQVASVIVHTNMALGILPLGSGNGLARSNGIPLNLEKALQVIEKENIRQIDGATINSHPFFCTAGVGFDALIATEFAASTKRGFITYFKTTLKEFFNYTPQQYKITVDGKSIETKAFLITIANAGQWGNDVYIAPEAKLNDGILNVSILKPFSLMAIPMIGIKLFSKKIHTSTLLQSEKGKEIDVEFKGQLPVHYDGEPMMVSENISVSVMPLALKMVC